MDKIERMEEWRWAMMPEFNQVKVEPFAKINFRFETEDDLRAFAESLREQHPDLVEVHSASQEA